MIRILAAKIEALPDVAEMRKSLPEGWLAAFDAAHKTARRESLGGLWLLLRAGFEGRLSYDDSGRPRFLGDAVSDLSLSHTGDLVVGAVASGEHGRVGIDAEDGARCPQAHMHLRVGGGGARGGERQNSAGEKRGENDEDDARER